MAPLPSPVRSGPRCIFTTAPPWRLDEGWAEGSSGHLTTRPMGQSDVYRMIGRRRARTTGLYDRRLDQVSLDEVERIRI